MENLKPNGQRSKNAITLIWFVLAMEFITLVSGYFQYRLLQSVASGESVSMETANANDLREQIIAILYVIVYIISAVTFIQWFRRAYFNLHQKVNHLKQPEGWAAGSWFVPILCWFKPYQIMKELYEETKELLKNKGLNISTNLTSSALGWWWTLFLINSFLGQFIFRYSMKAETIDELTTSTIAGMIGNIVGIPLALITVKVIKDYSDIEYLLNDRVENEAEETQISNVI